MMKIVRLEKLTQIRGYVLIAVFVIAAIITPPDLMSQILLLIPLLLLFEGSLLVMWLGERKEAKVAAAVGSNVPEVLP